MDAQVAQVERARKPIWPKVVLGAGGAALLALVVYLACGLWVKSSDEAALAGARRLLSQGKPKDACQSLEWLLWFQPDHAEALMLCGHCQAAADDFDAAAASFGRIPLESSHHETASLQQALAYQDNARMEACEQILKQHLQLYPDSQKAYEELKWHYFNQFRERELEQFLLENLERSPGDPVILVDLLNTEIREQVAQEAIGLLKRIDARQSGQPSILLALGYSYWSLGDLKRARELFDTCLRLRPHHAETRLRAAEFLLEQNQLDGAKALLKTGEHAPESLAADFERDDRWHWLQGRMAEQREAYEEALGHIEQALKLRPFELKYKQKRGHLLQSLGRSAEAAQVFREANASAVAEQQLFRIVLEGGLQQPTPEFCTEIARLCEARGRLKQAAGWRSLTAQLEAAQQNGRPKSIFTQ